MAQGLFTTGFSLDDVLKIQTKAKQMVLEGKTILQWGEGGTSSQKQFTLPVDKVLEECRYALKKLDPTTFGRRASKTVASFSGNF